MNNKERISEIIRLYELLTELSRIITDELNTIWETKEILREEFQILTGKDISARHELK